MSQSRDDLTSLENALCELTPQPLLSRDQLLFAAGCAAVPGRGWWPHLCGVLTLALLALTAWVVWRPEPTTQIVYVPIMLPADSPELPRSFDKAPPPLDTDTYLQRREQLLRQGVESMPANPTLEPSGTLLTPNSTWPID